MKLKRPYYNDLKKVNKIKKVKVSQSLSPNYSTNL